MPNSKGWDKWDEKQYLRTLRTIQAGEFFVPTEIAWQETLRTFPLPAYELVFTRNGGREILLAQYDGGLKESLGHWHLPGGFNRLNESAWETANRIAVREIKVPLYQFDDAHAIGVYKWQEGEHPVGRPLSLFTVVFPREPIQETEAVRFFGVSDLPSPLCGGAHAYFLQNYEEMFLPLMNFLNLVTSSA